MATPVYTAPPTVSNGGLVLASDMRTVADDVAFLTAFKPAARVYRAASMTGATGAFTPVPFDTETYDSHAAVNDGVFVAPIAGYYRASAAVHVTATAGSQRLVLILTGPLGGHIGRGRDSLSQAAGTLGATASAEYALAAGDPIQAEYYLDLALSFVVGAALAYLSIDYVRPL